MDVLFGSLSSAILVPCHRCTSSRRSCTGDHAATRVVCSIFTLICAGTHAAMNCVLRSSFTASKVRPSTLVWRCTLALRLPRGVSLRHSQSCRPFLRSFAATLLDDRAAHLGHCRRYRARPGCSWSLRCRRAVAIASRGGDEHVHDCRGAHEALAVYVTLCLIHTELGRTTSVAHR